jgi:hypothetical protein
MKNVTTINSTTLHQNIKRVMKNNTTINNTNVQNAIME